MGKIISFQSALQKKRKTAAQNRTWGMHRRTGETEYTCYVTPERLSGYCELLICENNQKRGEWFSLAFSPEGLIRYTALGQAGIRIWMQERASREITYLQAIRLLGDAVRQRYKYGKSTDWIPEETSVHLQRIWLEDYYSDQAGEIGWLLPKQGCDAMLRTWFLAVSNKDAALVYDLSAAQVQLGERRSIFAHAWNHVLEDMHILDYEVDLKSVRCNGTDDYILFLTVYGECCNTKLMEVDLCIRILEEENGFRVLQDWVLESRVLYRKQYS